MDAPAQFQIEVSAGDAGEEDVDRMTRQLLAELRESDVESVELVRAGATPPGTKTGDAVTIGSIAISAVPAVLPAVIGLVQGWASRGRGRTVKFKGKFGQDEIEFEGSPEDLQKLLDTLEAQRRGRDKGPVDSRSEEGQQIAQRSSGSEPAQFPNIFISYRRADSADVAGRIYDRLAGHFGKSAVFKDVDSIPAGTDFKQHLERAVEQCRVFLVVIGDKWLETADPSQTRRLQNPRDFVRVELEAALARNILVIPLLVRGASMPAEEALPPSLRNLVYRNALSVRPDPDFHRDMERLIGAIVDYASNLA